jgi:spermidine/putrescine transport system permease protein
MATMVLAHITFCIPYVFIIVKGRIAGLDPQMEAAARDLGASPVRVFFDITLPLIFPAVLAGMLLAFAMSFDDVIISFFVTGPGAQTLPLKVYSSLKVGVTPEINALCTVMLGVVFLFVAVSQRIRVKKS